MKLIPILILAAMVGLSSCSTSKQAQSSDDVYYSPGGHAYSGYSGNSSYSNNQGEYYDANPNDQYLMMKVQDPNRWSTFDDYGYDSYYPSYYGSGFYPYAYSGLGFGLGFGYYSPFSPWGTFGFWDPYFGYMGTYYAWNAFYNPYYYYGNVAYYGGKSSTYSTYTGYHPFSYNTFARTTRFSNGFTNANGQRVGFANNSRPVYTQQRTNSFNNTSGRSFNTYQPSRSFSPSSFGSGGGGSRFGGGGGGGFGRH